MSKINVTGTVFTINSEIKMDDLKKVYMYRPRALTVFEEDESGKKVPAFSVAATKPGMGTINEFGVAFGDTSFDGTGTCCLTIGIPAGTEDVRKYINDTVGMSIVMLDKVEAQIAPALEEITADEATVAEHITIA